jgi:hypothetical protein
VVDEREQLETLRLDQVDEPLDGGRELEWA